MKIYQLMMVLGLALLFPATLAARNRPGQAEPPADRAPAELAWQTAARLRHGWSSTRGTLLVDARGIAFQPAKGEVRRWPWVEIRTLDLRPRRLELTGYQNRGWRRPGDRRFRFDLDNAMTAALAAQLAERVGKPVRNRLPLPQASAWASLPARHRTRTGGSNGVLRFTAQGIDYLTSKPGDSRAWRWRDLETVSHPDAYHLRVFGSRDTYAFELKEAMSGALFDRVSERILQANPLVESPGERR